MGQHTREQRKGKRSHHLPGEPQAADRGVVQSHNHGVEGQQVLILLAAAGLGEGVSGRSGGPVAGPMSALGLPSQPHSHGSNLDELFEQLRALARGLAE